MTVNSQLIEGRLDKDAFSQSLTVASKCLITPKNGYPPQRMEASGTSEQMQMGQGH